MGGRCLYEFPRDTIINYRKPGGSRQPTFILKARSLKSRCVCRAVCSLKALENLFLPQCQQATDHNTNAWWTLCAVLPVDGCGTRETERKRIIIKTFKSRDVERLKKEYRGIVGREKAKQNKTKHILRAI